MPLNLVHTDNAPAAIGPYSQGIRVQGFVFGSGQLGIDPHTGKIPEDVRAQTLMALANVEAIMAAGGSSRKKIVKITIFMTDIADYPVINEVYTEFFQGHGILPARSALQVAALPKPEAKVEIEAIGRLEA
ncbi:MAG: hypothetical protein H6685_10265 [Deltaproteobacteria bacterium]|nr:hypothetical protein [Deltaproteobacteria bacterium]